MRSPVFPLKEPSASGPGRRLLLIAYHFPPDTGIGALRWQRMLPLLEERGWGADVITKAPPEDGQDSGGLRSLPPSTRVLAVEDRPLIAQRLEHAAWVAYRVGSGVFRAIGRSRASAREGSPGAPQDGGRRSSAPGARRPSSIPADEIAAAPASVRGWLRSYWAHTERSRARSWAMRAARAAVQVVDDRHGVIVVTSPPHWTQAAGLRLTAETGLPYIADLRDPWTATGFLPEHVASPRWFEMARADERSVMRAARFVLANTEASAEALRASYPDAGARVRVVRNGWDEATPRTEADRFLVAYAGSIYGDRDPVPLLEAVAMLRQSRELTSERFGVVFMGHFDRGEDWLRQLAADHGIADLVEVSPPAGRAEARRLQAAAAVLVSLPWGQDLSVPAKIYEYLSHEAWPLVLAAPGSAPDRMLRGSGATVVDPRQVAEVCRTLCDRFDRWQSGERPGAVAGRERFHRRVAVDALVEALEIAVE